MPSSHSESTGLIGQAPNLSYSKLEMDSTDSSKRVEPEDNKYLLGLVVCSWTATVLFAGALFGWASLQLMLENDGVFHAQCKDKYLIDNFDGDERKINSQSSDTVCAQQSENLTLVYSVGSTLQIFSSFAIGYFIDAYGPLKAITLGGTLMCGGIYCFAVADVNSLNSFLVAISLMAIGANFTYLTSFSCSFVVPERHMSTFNTVNSCLYDTSCIIYFLFYQMTQVWHVTRSQVLMGYLVMSVVVYGCLVFFWTRCEDILTAKKERLEQEMVAKEYNVVSAGLKDDEDTEADDVDVDAENGRSKSSNYSSSSNNKDNSSSGTPNKVNPMEFKMMHSMPWHKQVFTPQFIGIALFSALHLLRASFYMGNMRNMLEGMGDASPENDNWYTTVYSIVVPMGFVVIPFVDTIIFRNTFKDSLNIITNISLGFGVLVCVPSLEAQLPGFLFFMVFRALLYSTVGTYIAHTFGPLNGGRTNGMVWLIASLFNFLIYPATILEEKLGDTLFTNLNLLLLALCVPLYAIVQCYLAPVLEKVGGADRPAELGE